MEHPTNEELVLAHFDLIIPYNINNVHLILTISVGLREQEAYSLLIPVVPLLQRNGFRLTTLAVSTMQNQYAAEADVEPTWAVEFSSSQANRLFDRLHIPEESSIDSSDDDEDTNDISLDTNSVSSMACPAPPLGSSSRSRKFCSLVRITGYRHCAAHVRIACSVLQAPEKLKAQQQLDWLRRWARSDRLWIVDTEFAKLRYSGALGFSVCIRRFIDDKPLINCTFDYGSCSFDQLMDIYIKMCPREHVMNEYTRGW